MREERLLVDAWLMESWEDELVFVCEWLPEKELSFSGNSEEKWPAFSPAQENRNSKRTDVISLFRFKRNPPMSLLELKHMRDDKENETPIGMLRLMVAVRFNWNELEGRNVE